MESVTKACADHDAIMNAPGLAIAVRSSRAKGFRPAFKLTKKKFVVVAQLLRQFRSPAAKPR